MSAWIKSYSLADISDQTQIVAQVECDTLADLPAVNAFYPRVLINSSTAHVIEGNTMHELNSAGQWIKQEKSPFADVYTKSQVDGLLANLQYQIDSMYKYNVAVEDIINYGIVKNYFTSTNGTQTITDVTFTNNGDGTWSTSGTAASRRQYAASFTMPAGMPNTTYKLTGCPIGGSSGATVHYCLYIWDLTENIRVTQNDTGEGVEFDWQPDPTHTYNLAIDIRSGTNADGLTFKPMITFKTYDDVTDTFRPHT